MQEIKLSSLVKLSNITKKYQIGGHTLFALNNIDLAIEKGEFVAIMGESGAGKSTAMNIIGLLDRATEGTYLLDNIDTQTLSRAEESKIRNQQIGFVFQSFFLLAQLTSLDNVALPLSYRGIHLKEARKIAMSFLKQLNIENLAKQKPQQMSGGQQQRVAVARALVGNPNILLADEPTGALDSQTGAELMALFSKLDENKDRTIIIVTHDPIVSSYCKRIIILKDGKIVSDEKNNPGPQSIQSISERMLQLNIRKSNNENTGETS